MHVEQLNSPLTVSAGGDVHRGGSRAHVTDAGHTVLSEDREHVGGVWEEPADDDPPPADAHLPRSVDDTVCTRNAEKPSAALALDAVSKITATAVVQRF